MAMRWDRSHPLPDPGRRIWDGPWTNHTGVTILTAVAYDVQTEVFDGPFDLLLHLILNQQVELYEISLTQIIDAYLAELDRLDSLDLDIATEFLLIAATLVELKTRRLLPEDADIDL